MEGYTSLPQTMVASRDTSGTDGCHIGAQVKMQGKRASVINPD